MTGKLTFDTGSTDRTGDIRIMGPKQETIVSISPEGTITYGEGYTPDLAAVAFWQALGYERTKVQPK